MSSIAKKLKSLTKKIASVAAILILASSAPISYEAYFRYGVGSEVVMITKTNNGRTNGGSGFHAKAPSGKVYIVTNKHVCDISKDGTLDVQNSSMSRPLSRKIIERYEDHDLCLVEALPGKSGLTIASDVEIGEDLRLIGHPNLRPLVVKKGEYIGDADIDIVTGYEKLSCKGKWFSDAFLREMFGIEGMCIETYHTMQASVTSYGGNSGSPVVNKYGNVIGVLFAGNTRVVDDAYVVPLKDLQDFLEVY